MSSSGGSVGNGGRMIKGDSVQMVTNGIPIEKKVNVSSSLDGCSGVRSDGVVMIGEGTAYRNKSVALVWKKMFVYSGSAGYVEFVLPLKWFGSSVSLIIVLIAAQVFRMNGFFIVVSVSTVGFVVCGVFQS